MSREGVDESLLARGHHLGALRSWPSDGQHEQDECDARIKVSSEGPNFKSRKGGRFEHLLDSYSSGTLKPFENCQALAVYCCETKAKYGAQ